MRIVFLALLFCVKATFAQGRPEIIFDHQIEIPSQKSWVLGDLVQMKNPSAVLLESVEKLVITPEQIERGLDAQGVREIYKNLVLQNPEVAHENPKLTVSQKLDIKIISGFSESHFRRKLINYLSSQCSPCEVTLQKMSLPPKIMPEGLIDWAEIKLAPSVLVPLQAGSSRHQQGQWISATVKIKKNALVAARNLNFGERISEKDFETKWMDISYSKEEPLNSESIKSYQLVAQPMIKGRIVVRSNLKQEPAAQKGQTVKALIGEDGIEISVSAIAEESGHIGDTIKIKNPENKKIMSVIIVEKGVVKIQ